MTVSRRHVQAAADSRTGTEENVDNVCEPALSQYIYIYIHMKTH